MLTIGYNILEKRRKKTKGTILGVLCIHTFFHGYKPISCIYTNPPTYSFLGLFITPYLSLKTPSRVFLFNFVVFKNWQNPPPPPKKIVLLVQFTLESRNLQNFHNFLNKKGKKIQEFFFSLVPSLNKFFFSNAGRKGD
jgi:hypothetical protein